MNSKNKRFLLFAAALGTALVLFEVPETQAQYGGYNQNYNNYNQYGGSQYGGSPYGGSSYGGSRFGGMSGGMTGRSGLSGRSGRTSQYNQYGNQGYNQGNYQGSSSRSGRSTSRSRNSGYQSYGNLPQSAQGQQNVTPGQTQPQNPASTRRSGLKGGAGAPGGDAAGGISVQGTAGGNAANTAPGAPGRVGAPASKPAKQAEIKTRQSAVLYLSTRDTIVLVDEPIPVDVVLANPKKNTYNKISFSLKYNPKELKPVAGKDSLDQWIPAASVSYSLDDSDKVEAKAAAPNAETVNTNAAPAASAKTDKATLEEKNAADAAPPVKTQTPFIIQKKAEVFKVVDNTVDDLNGIITFSAAVTGDNINESGVVARITFLTLAESSSSSLEFLYEEPGKEGEGDLLTALSSAKEDRLGATSNPYDGTINLDFQIVSSYEKAKSKPIVKRADERDSETSEDIYNTRLRLISRQENVDVGEPIDVDIYLDNKDKAQIDSVSLLIAYNPRCLEVIDSDDFASGVNIDDKEYKKDFPFDFPKMNTVDADKGIVDYRKMGYKVPIRGDGVLATIHFKTLRPTKKTTLRVFLNESGEDPTTGIFYRYKDRLGDPKDPFDGVTTCSVSVQATAAYIKKVRPSGDRG
ncbi:MAG: cohesin domain-containing protein [Candidatus Omnitrophota bacterium]